MPRPKFKKPEHLQHLEFVGLDMETYFDKDYSLRKQNMSTSLYVKDERFKIQGVGIQRERQHKPRWYDAKSAVAAVQDIDWSKTALLAHHAQFDGFILTQRCNVVPAYYLCSLSMARGLHSSEIGASLDEVATFYGLRNKLPDVLEKTKGVRELPKELSDQLGAYCAVDVEIMWGVFSAMRPQLPDKQLDVINMIVAMFCEPQLLVDRERAAADLRRELAERKALMLKAVGKRELKEHYTWVAKKERVPVEALDDEQVAIKVLGADATFTQLLESRGITAPLKWSDKQKKAVPAFAKTDLDFQALQETKRGKLLYDARLAAKSTNQISKGGGLLKRSLGGAPLPVYLKYFGAHTGRKSGGDKLNPQNFKRKSELRRSLVAPKGWRICVVDASQIEARIGAYIADQQSLLDAFRAPDRDPYCEFASSVYGFTVNKEDHELERFIGKTSVLGLGFQMGAEKFQDTLAKGTMGPAVTITLKEARKIVALYRTTNNMLPAMWKLLQKLIYSALIQGHDFALKDGLFTLERGRIRKPDGMYLKYPKIRQHYDKDEQRSKFVYDYKHEVKPIYGGLLLENVVQAWAADMADTWALALERDFPICMLTHDEVVFMAREHEADAAVAHAIDIMSVSPSEAPDLPLGAEGGHDHCYSK